MAAEHCQQADGHALLFGPQYHLAGDVMQALSGRGDFELSDRLAHHAHMSDMTPLQPDLFAAPPPLIDGLSSKADIISHEEELELVARINAADLAPFAFQGWLGKRMTASFGSDYDFEKGRLFTAPPVPDWLLPLRGRLAQWAGLQPEALVQALVIRYDPGAGIGWHRDRPQYGTIMGLSLGASDTLRLRRRRTDGGFDRYALPLMPRAAYRLDKAARWEWEHSITPAAKTRWSITFRTMRDQSAQ